LVSWFKNIIGYEIVKNDNRFIGRYLGIRKGIVMLSSQSLEMEGIVI